MTDGDKTPDVVEVLDSRRSLVEVPTCELKGVGSRLLLT
jgi:hypothetical protein